jgi:hypothetical protein
MRPRDDEEPSPLLGCEFGFVVGISPETAENLNALFADAPVDEDVDRRIAEWRCPGCGRGMDELTEGHAWSYDTKTKQYQCDDPPYPGGPTQFTMDCAIPELTGADADFEIVWEHR